MSLDPYFSVPVVTCWHMQPRCAARASLGCCAHERAMGRRCRRWHSSGTRGMLPLQATDV